ncbi:6-phosphofructokinase [Elusimicrobiota bacterium]
MKQIGILTSGGDCPGLNACIRAVVRLGIQKGFDVTGFRRGYEGLIDNDAVMLDRNSVGGIISQGGTMLLSARSKRFQTRNGKEKAARSLNMRRIEGLIVLGGNGSLRGAWELAKLTKTAVIGIPKSIDNDVGGTDFSIGFDTAANTAVEAIDKIRDTATSHEKLFIVEVMGRSMGHLALFSGIAGGAEHILIPETPTNISKICKKLDEGIARGKRSSILVVAEGDEKGGAFEIARKISKHADYDPRVIVMGHIQRGGRPSAFDRILAARFGRAAVDALKKKKRSKMVGIQRNRIITSPLEKSFKRPNPLDACLIGLADSLS